MPPATSTQGSPKKELKWRMTSALQISWVVVLCSVMMCFPFNFVITLYHIGAYLSSPIVFIFSRYDVPRFQSRNRVSRVSARLADLRHKR